MSTKLNQEIQILINKYKQQNFSDVIQKSSVLLKKYPKNDFLWNLVGLCFQRIQNNKSAITSFQNAIESNPNNDSAKNNLAISYKNTRQYGNAEKILKELIKKNPNYLNALVNLGNLQNQTYFFDEALENLEKAIKIKNDLPEVHLNIANILQIRGKMKEAIIYLQKALELNKNFTKADQVLSMLLNYNNTNNDHHLQNMLEKLNNPELNNDDKINLHFALGKCFEDKKNYEDSFKHLNLGNKLQEKVAKSNLKYFRQKSENIKDFFLNIDLKKVEKKNDDGKKIFILGLPRSGTTLLEKIVSSHSKVGSVSEIGFIYDTINENTSIKQKFDKTKANEFINSDLSKKYNDILKFYNIKKEFIIDKTLINFWYVGFIKIFFPKSKIIHSFRNPKDNCLSIFKNLFRNNETWLFNQEDIGEYYLIYNDLMKFWNQMFEGEIYNSRYEDLINDHEKNTKDLIKYCELDWEEACLSHHKNQNPIKTLSVNQANQPIYKTSINSSKFFENKLDKLYKILDKLN